FYREANAGRVGVNEDLRGRQRALGSQRRSGAQYQRKARIIGGSGSHRKAVARARGQQLLGAGGGIAQVQRRSAKIGQVSDFEGEAARRRHGQRERYHYLGGAGQRR